MFLVNSRHPHFSAAPQGLERESFTLKSTPSSEVTGLFAEFLGQSSLERLGLFTPPTCVGFRYGLRALNLGAFLGSRGSTASDLAVTDSRLGL